MPAGPPFVSPPWPAPGEGARLPRTPGSPRTPGLVHRTASSSPLPAHPSLPHIPALRAFPARGPPQRGAPAAAALTVPRGADGSVLTTAPGEGAGARRHLRPPPAGAAAGSPPPAPPRTGGAPPARRLQPGAPRKLPYPATARPPHLHPRTAGANSARDPGWEQTSENRAPSKALPLFPVPVRVRSHRPINQRPVRVLPISPDPAEVPPREGCPGHSRATLLLRCLYQLLKPAVCWYLLAAFHTGHLTSK